MSSLISFWASDPQTHPHPHLTPPTWNFQSPLWVRHGSYVLEPHVQSNYSVQEKPGKLSICFRTFLVVFCLKMNDAVS